MEEEPGMAGPKQRRKVTGYEEKAFPRHTQVSAKEGSYRRRSKEVERKPAEVEMQKKGISKVQRGLMEA